MQVPAETIASQPALALAPPSRVAPVVESFIRSMNPRSVRLEWDSAHRVLTVDPGVGMTMTVTLADAAGGGTAITVASHLPANSHAEPRTARELDEWRAETGEIMTELAEDLAAQVGARSVAGAAL